MPSNVLIICSDEHARNALGCYGHPIAQTPALDALAARGTRFTRAYTPSPICVPARACLATGRPVHETRCWSSAEPYHGQIESWMHRLRDAGHAVVSIGKLHFRSADDDHGFAEEILPMYVANDGLGWPQSLIRQPLPDFRDARELAAMLGPGESDYTQYDRRITAAGCAWLRGRRPLRRDAPWALFVSFVSPHYPLIAPAPFFDLYRERPIPVPDPTPPQHPVLRRMARFWDYDQYFDERTRALARRSYYGLCSFLDDQVRQVLAALEDSGLADDTLVLYLSDHGEMLGSHGFWTKSVMYEDAVGVPLIMAGPGVPIGVSQTPISLIDVAPTVERAVGLSPLPTYRTSRPLQDLIATPDPGRAILSEYHDGGSPTGFFMVRQGDWKYVYYAGGDPPQLFDLGRDPDEVADRGQDPRSRRQCRRLHELLESMLDPEAVNAAAFRDQSERLAALGGREQVLGMASFNHTPIAG